MKMLMVGEERREGVAWSGGGGKSQLEEISIHRDCEVVADFKSSNVWAESSQRQGKEQMITEAICQR